MSKLQLELYSNYRQNGSFSPFRDLAKKLYKNNQVPLGYESLVDLLTYNLSKKGQFVPPLDDPGTPTYEFTRRIADGVVTLSKELIENGHTFDIFISGKLDPWSRFCVDRINSGVNNKVNLHFLGNVEDTYEVSNTILKDRVKMAKSYGFTWDIVNTLLRERNIRNSDPSFSHSYLGTAYLSYNRFKFARNHYSIAALSNNSFIRANAKIGLINSLLRIKGISKEEIRKVMASLKDDVLKVEDNFERIKLEVWIPNLEAFIELKYGNIEKASSLIETAIDLAEANQQKRFLGVFLKNKSALIKPTSEHAIEQKISLLKKAILLRPYDQDWHVELGNIYLTNNKYESAFEEFNNAYEKGLPHPDALLGISKCLRLNGNYKKAIFMIKDAHEFRPERIDLIIDLAKNYMESGDISSGITFLINSWRENPNNFQLASHLIQLLISHKVVNYSDDVISILKLMTVDLSDRLHLLLGVYFFEMDLYELAQTHLVRAKESRIDNIVALSLFYEGKLLEKYGNLDDAYINYEKCLEINPNNKTFYNAKMNLKGELYK